MDEIDVSKCFTGSLAERLRYTAMYRPLKGRKHDCDLMLEAADVLDEITKLLNQGILTSFPPNA